MSPQRREGRLSSQLDATPDAKSHGGEAESSKKVSPKRAMGKQPEDISGQAKKAKVTNDDSPTPPQIDNAERPGPHRSGPLQSDTPAGANSPKLPQPPQSPASERSVIDKLEDSQEDDQSHTASEAGDKLDKRRKIMFIVATSNWPEDSAGSARWEQVGVGQYSCQTLLESVLNPVIIVTAILGGVLPRITKMLQFLEPLLFGLSSDGERAYCAAWNKDHAKAAFKGPGFYLAAGCLHWFDLLEQPGEFSSWRNVVTCAREFWSVPNPNPRC